METQIHSNTAVDFNSCPPCNKPRQDFDLIAAFCEGDESAFQELHMKYQGRIYRQCLRMVYDSQECADLTQEIWLKVFRKLETYNPTASFYTWLYRITSNCCIDHRRKKKRQRLRGEASAGSGFDDGSEVEIPDDTFNPERQSMKSELGGIIGKAIAALPDKLRSALLLREMDGLSYMETAELLGCAVGTVKTRIRRAREELKKLLAPVKEAWI